MMVYMGALFWIGGAFMIPKEGEDPMKAAMQGSHIMLAIMVMMFGAMQMA